MPLFELTKDYVQISSLQNVKNRKPREGAIPTEAPFPQEKKDKKEKDEEENPTVNIKPSQRNGVTLETRPSTIPHERTHSGERKEKRRETHKQTKHTQTQNTHKTTTTHTCTPHLSLPLPLTPTSHFRR
jgi:hypothetical protein